MRSDWVTLWALGLMTAGAAGCSNGHSETLAPDSTLPVAPSIIIDKPKGSSPTPTPLRGVVPKGLRGIARLAQAPQERAVAARMRVISPISTGFTVWPSNPASLERCLSRS